MALGGWVMGVAEPVDATVTDWTEVLGAARRLVTLNDPAASARYVTEFGLELLGLCHQPGLNNFERETLVMHAELWLSRPRWSPDELKELLSRQLATYARFEALDPFTKEAFGQLAVRLGSAA
jgi:hypothetical protein